MKPFNIDDVFKPQARQLECYRWIGRKGVIFYGGTRGGGKTATGVWIPMMCCLQYPGLRVGIFRKTMPEIKAQIIAKEVRRWLKYENELGFSFRRAESLIEFDNGSMIFFRGLETDADIEKEQGIERDLIVIDEAPQHKWSTIIAMLGSNRSAGITHATSGRKWRETMLLTGNPGGISQTEFKYHFIQPDYSRWEEGELNLKDEYVFVQASYSDNAYLSERYMQNLLSQPHWRREQWLKNNWDAQGGTFFEKWVERIHVDDSDEPVPAHWTRWRAIDLGYQSHPSVCLWLAQDPVTADVLIYDELSTTETATDKFIRMIAEKSGDGKYVANYADPAMWTARKETALQRSPAHMFLDDASIYLQPADNAREAGWRNVMQWMDWDGDADTGEVLRMPKLRVRRRCRGLIETIPIQTYVDHKFDLNSRGKDDYVDALRYALCRIPYNKRLKPDGQVDLRGEYIFGNPAMEVRGGKTSVASTRPLREGASPSVLQMTERYGVRGKRYYQDEEGTLCSPYSLF